jgi:hypothetical protein
MTILMRTPITARSEGFACAADIDMDALQLQEAS